MKKDLQRASITVETALLMPLILYVIFALLYINFHTYNRVWARECAEEAALDGIIGAVKRGEDGQRQMDIKLEQCKRSLPFAMFGVQTRAKSDKRKVTVTIEGETKAIWGGFRWKIKEETNRKIIKPVVFIRQVRLWTEE